MLSIGFFIPEVFPLYPGTQGRYLGGVGLWDGAFLSLPILAISERNLDFMWVCGNSRIQLVIAPSASSR
jgi:hypothetical protein